MAGKAGTIELIAQQLGLALQPLQSYLTPVNIESLLAELGLQFPPQLLQPKFVAALNAGSAAAGSLQNTLKQLATDIADDNEAGIVQGGAQLIQEIRQVIGALPQIGIELGSLAAALPGMKPAEVTTFATELPHNLLSHMLISHLEGTMPGLVGIANLLGIISYAPNDGIDGDVTHPPHVKRRLQLGNVSAAISSPKELLKSLYGWGNPGFDGALLIPTLSATFDLFRLYSEVLTPGPPIAMTSGLLSIEAVTGPPGLAATLNYDLPARFDLNLPISPLWSAHMQVQGAFKAGLQASIVAPLEIKLKPLTGTLNGMLRTDLIARGPDLKHPIIIFGQAGGSRLQAESLTVGIGLQVTWDAAAASADADPVVQMSMAGGKAVIDLSKADGFIGTILGGSNLESTLDLGLTYSIAEGLRFRGSSALEIQLAQHVSLGPVAVNNLALVLGIKGGAFPLTVTADFQASFGPLTAVIAGIGFRLTTTIKGDNKGNLGPIDIQPGFQPPKGVGLELAAGGFTGGGFLLLDPDKGEYAGGLELMFLGAISVRAVGILSTRLPDGSKGFSLLIILVSEFPPIQLSYGFTLVGIGGLLGLNRTVLVDELQAGVRDGSLNSILFPTDIVANASRIIGDIKRIFPPRDGRFLVGPMAKLGWGTPTLISLSVGLILEIPRPMFAFVGVLHMALPTEDLPILHLQVSFAGSVDFESGRLQFDASLYDSRVMTFTLSGDMALRVYWKDNANFLLSVGGFHPAYTPPPMNLGEMARLGMVLFQGIPHMSAQVYFAVTTNTVQFGARVEVYYGIDLFNVYGFLGLDVLINFNPFHFVAEIEAEIGVRTGSTVLFSITLQLTLEGPSPWHARGTGSFRIGFIIKVKVSANFDVSFGDPQETHLDSIDVLAEMAKALGNLGNWRPRLPAGSNQHVTLRALPDPTTTLVLHPFGALEVSQKLVPLHVAVQRFGTQTPKAGSVFTLAEVKLGAEPAAVTNTREQFAPAQFFDLTDAEKLSRPSFADYDAGIVIGGDLAAQTDFQRARDVVYESIYLPEPHPFSQLYVMADTLASYVALGSAVAQSPVSQARNSVSVLEQKFSLAPERYAVVSTDDLTMHAAELVFDNATAADQAVQRIVADRPEFFGAIQAVPMSAVAAGRIV
jgi:hypothetical protein